MDAELTDPGVLIANRTLGGRLCTRTNNHREDSAWQTNLSRFQAQIGNINTEIGIGVDVPLGPAADRVHTKVVVTFAAQRVKYGQ